MDGLQAGYQVMKIRVLTVPVDALDGQRSTMRIGWRNLQFALQSRMRCADWPSAVTKVHLSSARTPTMQGEAAVDGPT